MFKIDCYFCEKCQQKPTITLTRLPTSRIILGCRNCPINSVAAAQAYELMYSWNTNIPSKTAIHSHGEVIMTYALNNGKNVFQGAVILSGMIDTHSIRQECSEIVLLRSRALNALQHNITVWKTSVLDSMTSNYCLPLSVLCLTNLTTVSVAKLVLLMIGNCFTDKQWSNKMIFQLLDSIVYNSTSSERIKV